MTGYVWLRVSWFFCLRITLVESHKDDVPVFIVNWKKGCWSKLPVISWRADINTLKEISSNSWKYAIVYQREIEKGCRFAFEIKYK